MNNKQYNNIIENTLKNEQKSDSLEIARAIFNNMGVALPNGNMGEVYEIIKGNDYMGWKSCTKEEAQQAADNGVAAIGISENRIVVLSATDDEEPVAQNETVMTLSSDLTDGEVSDLSYYTYSYGTTGWGDGSGTTTHRKAIIIVPGVMGTELELATATDEFGVGTSVWPPDGIKENIDLQKLLEIIKILELLECDNDGRSMYDLRVKDGSKYGTENLYNNLYTQLQDYYGSNYDVVFYGYDWRQSNLVSGMFLMNLVEQYESVIVIAHSMGGLVTSHLLRASNIRSKIEKVITLGTPFLGSLEMLPLMYGGQLEALESYLEGRQWYSILGASLLLKPVLRRLSLNIPSLYELLPTKQFFDLGSRWYFVEQASSGQGIIKYDFDTTRSSLCSEISNFNCAIFDQATSRHDTLWEDEETHITSYVNTYYIAGEGKTTGDRFYSSSPYPTSTVDAGDGTVLSYSASMNDLYPGKTFFVDESHVGLLSNQNVIDLIQAIINESSLDIDGIKTTAEYTI